MKRLQMLLLDTRALRGNTAQVVHVEGTRGKHERGLNSVGAQGCRHSDLDLILATCMRTARCKLLSFW
uniref:Uncharacterized protein n=1 Tax=Arundo donax TaxID=35708 RepID=A0A0A9GRS2_ARUDO